MGRLKVLDEPVSGVERLLEAAKHAGLENLQAVLACTFTFDRGYFEQVLDALIENHADGRDVLRGVPIDVACDHRHYRGHGAGYNVHCWKESNLFHAKLLMLSFADRLVWLEGSLNLTRAGHGVNRELASYHESDRRALPTGVLTLLRRLALQGLDAARLIARSVGRRRIVSRNRSVTSLDTPLLNGILGRVKHATQVVLVAPFFDQREQGEPTIDTTALRRLAHAYPATPFRIYLPQVTGPNGKDALQGHRAVFSNAFGPNAEIERVAFCGVPSDHYPLHAKLIAIQHGTRGAESTLLTGSPNVTENALMRKGASANVELARELQVRWRHSEALLGRLGRKFKSLSECRFVPPPPIKMFGWHALQSAVYDPLRGELELIWLKPMNETILRYAGKPLHLPSEGSISGAIIRADDLRLQTVCRDDPSRYSWCPIVIPIDVRLALADLPELESPPEWWIMQLGALSGFSKRREGVAGLGAGTTSASPTPFPLAYRVRDFAQRMNFAVAELTSADGTSERIPGLLNLLDKIFRVHDPVTATTAMDRTWRLWVRLEVTQALASSSASGQAGSRKVGRLARDLKARLAATEVPPDAEKAWHALTEMMR
jgi:hypothetical protein